jgi:GMP synthase (glutamine-hydrolysing)
MAQLDSPRVLVVQHQDDCPPALVGEWLEEAGCALDVRRPYAGDALPEDLAEHDAFLVLGGSMGADDEADHPWLAPTKELVRRAAASATPTLGICLGHQLAAVALGGEVGRNPAGQQLGLLPIGWTAAASDDELTSCVLEADVGIHWNDDVVVRAPDGTEVLAVAPGGELQVARFAPRVWGVQLHPEVDAHILDVWAEEDPDRYAAGVLDDVLGRIRAARAQLEAGWRPLAQRLAHLP